MKLKCPNCGNTFNGPIVEKSTIMACPSCRESLSVLPVPLAVAKPGKRNAKLKPGASPSIYAWLVGLPAGILLISLSLLVMVPLGIFLYGSWKAAKLAEERVAAEARVKEERLSNERFAEQRRIESEERLRREEVEKKHQRELEQLRADQDRARLEAEQRRRATELEKDRLVKEEKRRREEGIQAEERRRQEAIQAAEAARLKTIEDDHAAIVQFLGSVKHNPIKNMVWDDPESAVETSDTGRRGTLYRADCQITIVTAGGNRQDVPRFLRFFLVNGGVAKWDIALDRDQPIKYCKATPAKKTSPPPGVTPEIVTTGAAAYDKFPEPLHSRCVDEWRKQVETFRRFANQKSTARTDEERRRDALCAVMYRRQLAWLEKNQPPYLGPLAYDQFSEPLRGRLVQDWDDEVTRTRNALGDAMGKFNQAQTNAERMASKADLDAIMARISALDWNDPPYLDKFFAGCRTPEEVERRAAQRR